MSWSSRERPFLSVCIPVYNGEAYIRQAVETALDQDYPDFEVCVSENCSSDETAVILRGIDNERLSVDYHSSHVPLAANLNRAARMGQSEYLLVMSADDQLPPGALEAFGRAVEAHPGADGFIGRASYIVEAGGRPLARAIYSHDPGPIDDLESFVVGNSFPVNINAMLLKREVAEFREDCGVVCDLDLLIRMALDDREVVLLDETVVEYREHPGATSANRVKMWRESLQVYRDYLPKTTRPELFRRRIFRLLFWCSAFLGQEGRVEEAREMVDSCRSDLGTAWWSLLRGSMILPITLPVLDRLRHFKGRLSGADSGV